MNNPTFYLWSNDLNNIDMSLFNAKFIKIFQMTNNILMI